MRNLTYLSDRQHTRFLFLIFSFFRFYHIKLFLYRHCPPPLSLPTPILRAHNITHTYLSICFVLSLSHSHSYSLTHQSLNYSHARSNTLSLSLSLSLLNQSLTPSLATTSKRMRARTHHTLSLSLSLLTHSLIRRSTTLSLIYKHTLFPYPSFHFFTCRRLCF